MNTHDDFANDGRAPEGASAEARESALLVAYVLGEADAAERATVERWLAERPELQAERARLEATIGLVRETFAQADGSADALSAGAAAELAQAARARLAQDERPRGAWSSFARSPLMRAAATIALVFGAWALYRAGAERTTELASLEPPRDAQAPRRGAARAESAVADGAKELEGKLAKGARDDEDDSLRGKDQVGKSSDVAAAEPAARAGVPIQTETAARGRDALAAGLEPQSELPTELGAPELAFEKKREGDVALVDRVEPGAVLGEEALGQSYGEGGSSNVQAGRVAEGVPTEPSGPVAPSSEAERLWSEASQEAEALRAELQAAAKEPPTQQQYLGYPPAKPGSGGAPQGAPRSAGELALPGSAGARSDAAAAVRSGAANVVKREMRYVGEADSAEGTDDFAGRGSATERARISDDFRLGLERAQSRPLTAEEARLWLEDFERSCQRRPSERPRDMFFRFWGDNPFEIAARDPQSTFSIDVDTASWNLARGLLRSGYLPPREQVRTEEFVNAFPADVPAPAEETFAIAAELAPSRFPNASPFGGDGRWMLRVALRGREVSRAERAPLALTFVVDTSGSMKEGGRLELVKHALRLLLAELDANDSIALVAFSREARLILPMTSASARGVIESALHPLSPDGGTNAEAGLEMGYAVALDGFTEGATNRVVFLSDGVANIGETDQDRINAQVQSQRERGIYLNTIGVGLANHNDVFLEQLADKGDGRCDYIDSPEAAERALVTNFTGTFETIARDVKIQVEFDPAQVLRYRLLGYENRAIADRDFRNDAVDAGEVGAGHQVVALYELLLASRPQGPEAEDQAPLATVRVRYKRPYSQGGSESGAAPQDEPAREIAASLRFSEAAGDFAQTSPGYRASILVAQFAEILRGSIHARAVAFADLSQPLGALRQELRGSAWDEPLDELAELVMRARSLTSERLPHSELERTIDLYRTNRYLAEEHAELSDDAEILSDLERQNADLAQRIRELLEREVQGR